MTLEQELRAFLMADAAITAQLGDVGAIYPAPAPQNCPSPFVTFQRITAERVYSNDGFSGLAGPIIQIDCWVESPELNGSYAAAKNLGEAVRRRLDGYVGPMGSIMTRGATIESERDLYESQDKTRRVSFDFRIWYDET